MFDVTADEIAQLNDTDLRELVGRLCEAELTRLGFSPSAATWGGSQTAADGGLDVRVALPLGTAIEGFIPRGSTGFQVKTPDMPRGQILGEMRPDSAIRPVIQELADEAGGYIIVSSKGSTADIALQNRRRAMREALDGVPNADALHTDFFDRSRLATWVRCFPGLVTWVKERIGRALVGWRPYGPWTGDQESTQAEYLSDNELRIHLTSHRDTQALPVHEAIDALRDELAQPRSVVRLVGLSGVGKTRLAQALFDCRIGARPLPPSLAVYTNLSDNPDPQPTGLASDLLATSMRSVLIVDNCPPDLHHALAALCRREASNVSLLTVEYDIRDDQPEGTHVVTLETASIDLIERLIHRRYEHISQVDTRTIAEASGGNARIAIALAETVGRTETIAGLSNEELFQRLFRQRHTESDALLRAAQVCSLVYSFQGEALDGDEAELPRIAALAEQTTAELYRHIAELLRRDLVQQRGAWRAVLPHAIANRLAARALQDIPYELIDRHLVTGGTDRLARSFSRRLAYLHEHPVAVSIVSRWLSPNQILGDATTLNNLGRDMFENVAPVAPGVTLGVLERAGAGDRAVAIDVWCQHLQLLRSLAYDADLFARCICILRVAALECTDERRAKEAADILVSLFALYLSGTHATLRQRIEVIDGLFRSGDEKACQLGLRAFDQALEATHFSPGYRFDFGARSRDYGYHPHSRSEVVCWYTEILRWARRLISDGHRSSDDLREVLARNFRGLWTFAGMHDELEGLFRELASGQFWRSGWVACRQARFFDNERLPSEVLSQLTALCAALAPTNLTERIRALVMGDRSGGIDFEELEIDGDGDIASQAERLDALAFQFGRTAIAENILTQDLVADLLRGGNRIWEFGRGLAQGAVDPHALWHTIVQGLASVESEHRDVQVLRGFLNGLWEREQDLAHDLLDEAANEPLVAMMLPILQSAVPLDSRGVERMMQALQNGLSPAWMFENLARGRVTEALTGSNLRDLLRLLVVQEGGYDAALNILYMRLYLDRSVGRAHEPELLEFSRSLLPLVPFRRGNDRNDHRIAAVARSCLRGEEATQLAAAVARQLRQAIAAYETNAHDNNNLLAALLEAAPFAVLDALFEGTVRDQRMGVRAFEHLGGHRTNPANGIPAEVLIRWAEYNPEVRFPLVAKIISFSSGSNDERPGDWSEQALAIISSAPNPSDVLAVFVSRFRPTSWSGSRAALMEANARLLDSLGPRIRPELRVFVDEARANLAREVVEERVQETERERVQNERFE